LEFIRDHGLDKFLEQQAARVRWLEAVLRDFDEGRSKSYYCTAASLLPIEDLQSSLDEARREIEAHKVKLDDKKTRSKILGGILAETAAKKSIELKLKKKSQ
jgi:hypothetical protein